MDTKGTLTWLIRSKAPLLGKMAEFLESTDTVCCKQTKQEFYWTDAVDKRVSNKHFWKILYIKNKYAKENYIWQQTKLCET